MYQTGEYIVYSNTGVCCVEGIGTPDGVSEKDGLYYKLRPVFDNEVIYTPVDTKAFMRPIMSREQAELLIDRIPDIPDDVCSGRDMKMLSESYRACLATHQSDDLIRLIKSVYRKNRRTLRAGRHPGQTDQVYMKRAEKLLYGELAVVLDMTYEQVQPYIHKRLEQAEKQEADEQ